MKKFIASAAAVAALMAGGNAFAQAANTDSDTATASVTIVTPLTITKNSDLAFGRIVKPRSGTGTITLANTGDSVVAGAGAVALSGITTSRATFTVDGEGGQVVTTSIPDTIAMTSGSNTITVDLLPNFGTSVTLSNALGATGSSALNVGGTFNLPDAQASGAYSGTFTVEVAYQ